MEVTHRAETSDERLGFVRESRSYILCTMRAQRRYLAIYEHCGGSFKGFLQFHHCPFSKTLSNVFNFLKIKIFEFLVTKE